MSKRPDRIFEYVVCIDIGGYPASLELHKIYRALPDEEAGADGDLRIIDESGEDYLFPASRFAFIDVPDSVQASFRKAS